MVEKRKTILTIIVTFVVTSLLVNTYRDIIAVRTSGKINSKVTAITELLDQYCLYEYDEEKLADFAASALTLAVDDHYTTYYTKEQFNSFKTNLQNSFYGVGIVLSVDTKENKLVVVSPIEGGPASEAGILPGDYIIEIDGAKFSGEEMNEAVSIMRGDDIEDKEGTSVNITIERDGVLKDFNVKRGMVYTNSVTDKMIDEGIGYIRISSFNAKDSTGPEALDTYDEFIQSINDLNSAGMKSLIIDLRNNPGGSLEVVNKIADVLLPVGVITYTEDKNGERIYYKSTEGEVSIPIALLVNGASASACEVLTGALKDYNKATVVGEKTFGKGIVQTVFPLRDGSGVSITTSKYFSPNGVCIHGVGIEPDIVIEMDEDKIISELEMSEDIQLQKAIEVLKK